MSQLFLNLAIILEVSTLWFPSQFLLLASVANCAKGMCWLFSASAKANANMRFAISKNIGDIASKNVSQ